jgi:hypothetical protein
MKIQKQNRHGFYLQKSNNRWKWMAGATAAAAAAGVTESRGNMVTINLVNNYISAERGNHLNADLTGDGHPDLTITRSGNSFVFYRTDTGTGSRLVYHGFARAHLNGILAGFFLHYDYYHTAYLGSQRSRYPRYLTGSIPIFFKDLHINGGAPTTGLLNVTVSQINVQLDSFTYNTPNQNSARAVPDHESSLALLAIGAGGILALRQRRAGQGQ